MKKTNTYTEKDEVRIQQLNWKNIGLWILQIALAAIFVMAGGSKILGVSDMIVLFENIGIGQWFRHLTGLLEIIAGILLIIPAFSAAGALLLACIMVGAIFIHLFLIGGSIAIPVVYLILSLILMWGRWNNLQKD